MARTKTPTSRAARKPRRPKVDQLAQDDAAASAAGVVVSARQERFALEYSIDGNGAGAARRSGYSKPSARHIAYELLRRPAVLERVRHYQAQHAAGSQFNRDALLRELGNVAYASLRDVVEIKGGRILLRKDADIPPEAWPAIAEISETKDRRIRVKLHPKMQAIDFLGRTSKMWEGSGAGSVKLTVRLVREVQASSALRLEAQSRVSGA